MKAGQLWIDACNTPNVGFGRRGLLEKGSFRKVHSLEILETLEILENPQTVENIRTFSRDSREFRDVRDSRNSSSQKTPFVMTPFSGPENGLSVPFAGALFNCLIVRHSPGFTCIGPQGGSKNIGLGLT